MTKSGVAIDQGALRVDATGLCDDRAAEFRREAAENASLFYRAKLRSQNLTARRSSRCGAWCRAWASSSRARPTGPSPERATGSASRRRPSWTPGQRAELVKLNLAVTGPGTVWIDAILVARPGAPPDGSGRGRPL